MLQKNICNNEVLASVSCSMGPQFLNIFLQEDVSQFC